MAKKATLEAAEVTEGFTTRFVTAKFVSMDGSELFFGKPVVSAKTSAETFDQFDERTWQEKVHCDEKGEVYWPNFAIKNALEEAGKFLSMKIPGEGKKTFTDRFRKGVIVPSPMYLFGRDGKSIVIDDVKRKPLFVPSDGKRGSGKRVTRVFPYLEKWQGEVLICVADPKISDNVLAHHLACVGQFIGFGSMRIGNGGVNGMSRVTLI